MRASTSRGRYDFSGLTTRSGDHGQAMSRKSTRKGKVEGKSDPSVEKGSQTGGILVAGPLCTITDRFAPRGRVPLGAEKGGLGQERPLASPLVGVASARNVYGIGCTLSDSRRRG